jgi:hypothetical protein
MWTFEHRDRWRKGRLNWAMRLNEFAARHRLEILEDLRAGRMPRVGAFDEALLRDARDKGREPQLGTTRYEPNAVHIEFIYPDPLSAAGIVTVTLEPPERIVYMPVPKWVVESIWQGEIAGSYEFESDALRMVDELRRQLEPEENPKHFGRRMPTGRG